MLQARGKSYHPSCFRCVVCRRGLEGRAFSVDADGRVYCVSDFHRWVQQQQQHHWRQKMKPNTYQTGCTLDESHPERLHRWVSVTFSFAFMFSGSELLCVLPAERRYCPPRWAGLFNSRRWYFLFLRCYLNSLLVVLGVRRGDSSGIVWQELPRRVLQWGGWPHLRKSSRLTHICLFICDESVVFGKISCLR